MARNNHNISDSKKFYAWIDNAEEDILSAELIINIPRCYKISAFHCQQSIEKSLKAYILFKRNQLVDGHNLLWLCRQAYKLDKSFLQWIDSCSILNHCYIETRYPSDLLFEISDDQMKEFFNCARDMFNFICNKIYKEYTSFEN